MPLRALLILLAVTLLLTLPLSAQRVIQPRRDLPVIQKVQLVFSLVGHHAHRPNSVNFYDYHGVPQGNTNYVVPHLVCDPLITLYNPHPNVLDLGAARVRISDPPVGFRFKKNDDYLRTEYAAGEFLGLARFQVFNDRNPAATKSFTAYLTERSETGPGDPVHLAPGETRLFSPWIEPEWTWRRETGAGYDSRSFFDWDVSADFTNRDGRTGNRYGFETVPVLYSWDARAGFQWDNLSDGTRPPESFYDFELDRVYGGPVAIRLDETFTIECRRHWVIADSDVADFRISLLSQYIEDPSRIHQEFGFEVGTEPGPAITRTFRVSDLLQLPDDVTPGGKTPVAVLTATARTRALLDGSLEEIGIFEGNEHFALRFDQAIDFHLLTDIGSEESQQPPVESPRILGSAMGADGRFHALVASPDGSAGAGVRGGATPDAMTTLPGEEVAVVPLPSGLPWLLGAKLDRVSIDATGRGPSYFIQVDDGAP